MRELFLLLCFLLTLAENRVVISVLVLVNLIRSILNELTDATILPLLSTAGLISFLTSGSLTSSKMQQEARRRTLAVLFQIWGRMDGIDRILV